MLAEPLAQKLTVEIYDIVPDALKDVTSAVARDKSAELLGLVHVDLQDAEQGDGHDREDDSEDAKSPPPADVVVEPLGCLGPGERGDHVRRGGESIGQPSVLQLGDVGREDVHAECHSSKADGVEDLE
jgi:hypothetical protein